MVRPWRDTTLITETMKHWKNIVLPLLLVPVLVTGCIKDDFDDCDNVTIYFQYLADGDEDVLYRYMDKVDLYVFDESGHILGSGTYNQEQLSAFAAVPSFKLTFADTPSIALRARAT